MSIASRSQVTITLGRGGRVVKRADDTSFADRLPIGSKRSVRDRLGNNVDLSPQVNKRMRGDASTANDVEDTHLSRDDLRFKIMQKKIMKQKQSHNKQHGIDLRNMLSRPAQSSSGSIVTRDHISKTKDTGLQYPDLRSSRQRLQEPEDGRQLTSVTRDTRQHHPEGRDQRMRDIREPRLPESSMVKPDTRDARHQSPEPRRSSSSVLYMPSLHTASGAPTADSVISSYSPWTIERLRRRSPVENLVSSRHLSPPSRDAELHRRLPIRIYDNSGMSTYMSKDGFNFSSSTNSESFMKKVVPSAGPSMTFSAFTLPGGDVHRSSHPVNDQLTVDSLLQSLGLEKYAIFFKAEEVDMYTLKQMGDSDLKELGIPLGPRKKILLALRPVPRQPAIL